MIISEPIIILELDVVLLKRIGKLQFIVLFKHFKKEGVSILEGFVVENS